MFNNVYSFETGLKNYSVKQKTTKDEKTVIQDPEKNPVLHSVYIILCYGMVWSSNFIDSIQLSQVLSTDLYFISKYKLKQFCRIFEIICISERTNTILSILFYS